MFCFDFSQYNCWKIYPEPRIYSFSYQFHPQKVLFKVPKIYNIIFWKTTSPATFGTIPKIHPIWSRDPSLSIGININSNMSWYLWKLDTHRKTNVMVVMLEMMEHSWKSHIFKSLVKPGGYYEVPFQVYEGLNEVPLVEQNLHFLIMCWTSIGTPLHTAWKKRVTFE